LIGLELIFGFSIWQLFIRTDIKRIKLRFFIN
jgi:hypothetical protein